MDRLYYQDSQGLDVVTRDGAVHVVTPRPTYVLNVAELAAFIRGLQDAHAAVVDQGASVKDPDEC